MFTVTVTTEDNKAVYDRYIAMVRGSTSSGAASVSMKEAVFGVDYRRATAICLIIALFTMQCGINGIAVYLSRILEKILPPSFPTNALTTAAIINTGGFIGALICCVITTMFGRRTIIIAGQVVMVLSQLIAGIGYTYQEPWSFVIGTAVFILTFNMTLGPMSWIYFAEVTVDISMGLVVLMVYVSALE